MRALLLNHGAILPLAGRWRRCLQNASDFGTLGHCFLTVVLLMLPQPFPSLLQEFSRSPHCLIVILSPNSLPKCFY